MKQWVILSLLSAICTSIITITLKKGVTNMLSADFTAYMSLLSFLLTMVINLLGHKKFNFNIWGLLAGVFLGISNLIFIRSSQIAPNPGIARALQKCQAIYTFIASYFIFGGVFKPYKIFGMILVIFGVYLVVKNEKRVDTANEAKENFTEQKPTKNLEKVKGNATNYWIKLALLAGLFSTFKDICSKKAISINNETPTNILANALLLQVIVTFSYKYYRTSSLRLETRQGDKLLKIRFTKALCYLFLTAFFFTIYSLSILDAMETAPNVGYVKSINTLGVVLAVILSQYIFKVKITKGSWWGILMTVSGLFFVVI